MVIRPYYLHTEWHIWSVSQPVVCRPQSSKLLCDWWFTTNEFVLASGPLSPTIKDFFFQMNSGSNGPYVLFLVGWDWVSWYCGHYWPIVPDGPYVTSSLTRGWVCQLQLLPALASAVILRSKSHRTQDHILLFQIWDSPNLECQVPVYISPRNRVAQLYPRHLVPFLTRTAMVDIFEYSSTWGTADHSLPTD
jgi:hypothetical protein